MNQLQSIGSPLAAALAALLIVSVSNAIVAAHDHSASISTTEARAMLKKDVGTWDAVMKAWHGPDTEPFEAKCTETNTMIGDLWVISSFTCDMGGTPFTGSGAFGYDPHEKKFVGTWVDSMNPSLTISKGDYNPDTKTFEMISNGRDPHSGKKKQSKYIGRYLDDNTRTFEIHDQGEDGEYWKMLEIHYKRRVE